MARNDINTALISGAVIALSLLVACGDDDEAPVDMSPGVDAAGDDGGPDLEDGGPDPADAETDGGGGGDSLATFETDVATAKCAALFRCCDASSIEDFFGQYECFPGLSCPYEDQQSALPPADMDACVAVMRELDEVTFGDWLVETRAGRVDFVAAAQASCLDDLATASCGAALEAALYDATCFARLATFEPGGAAPAPRAMFERAAGVGEDCVTFYEESYGSCDPDVAFCCVGGEGSCSVGGLGGDAGTCVGVSAVGESCSQSPAQLCAPELRCPPATGIGDPTSCELVPDPAPLDEGDACLNDSFESLGECTDSYCDQSTRVCTAPKANGTDCNADEECVSGNCETSGTPPIVSRECADPSFCIGT